MSNKPTETQRLTVEELRDQMRVIKMPDCDYWVVVGGPVWSQSEFFTSEEAATQWAIEKLMGINDD